MAIDRDALGLALLGVGIGAVIAAASTNSKREAFRESLAREMRERWLGELVNCELGRNAQGQYWQLTINHPVLGVQSVVIRLPGVEPYSNDALAFVLDRLARWVFQSDR